jgi:hypothetical protein
LVLGVGVALFPSNYEIRGMEDDEETPPSEGASSVDKASADA